MQSPDIYSGSIDHSRMTWWWSHYGNFKFKFYFSSQGNDNGGTSNLCTDTVSNDQGGITDFALWEPRAPHIWEVLLACLLAILCLEITRRVTSNLINLNCFLLEYHFSFELKKGLRALMKQK